MYDTWDSIADLLKMGAIIFIVLPLLGLLFSLLMWLLPFVLGFFVLVAVISILSEPPPG